MKILVVQIRRLGDTLLCTPLLRALKGLRADVRVDVLVEPFSSRALRKNPHVDNIIDPRGGPTLAWRLRRERYDVVIDCLGTPRTARLAWLSGAPQRIGFRRPWRSGFYTDLVEPPPETLYSAMGKLMLGSPLGIESADPRLDWQVSSADREEASSELAALDLPVDAHLIAFSPVSRRQDKRWPPERFAAVCDHWHESAGWRYLALYGPGEEDQVHAVLAEAQHPEAHLVPRRALSLGGLGAALEGCRLFLGNDNAIRHIAIALGLPTAAVFGKPQPRSWTPPGDSRHVTVGGARPVVETPIDALDEALTALVRMLREEATARGAP